MRAWFRKRPAALMALGVTAGLAVGVAATLAFSSPRAASEEQQMLELYRQAKAGQLHAVATHGGQGMILATGPVDTDAEGLYILDLATGDLQCWVINIRGGGWIGQFKTNVAEGLALDISKKPDLMMVTGAMQFRGGVVDIAAPAGCIVYVADGGTGNVAAYSFGWSVPKARAGAVQGGPMVLVASGVGRTAVERE